MTTFSIVISFLRQRPGLVRADHRRRAERLDRGELLDDRLPARHPLHAEREHHRQHRRQPLRHRGDGQRHADEQHVDEVGRVSDVGGEQDRRHDHDARSRSPRSRASGRSGRPRAAAACVCSSVRPSRRATLPISVAIPVAVTTARPRPRVTAVPLNTMLTRSPRPLAPLSERDVLEHRLALAGQRRLGDRERRRLDQPGVGRDRVALGEQQHVAGHDLGRRDPLLAPVAHDPRRRRRHPLQRRDRLLGARLLDVAEHGVERRRSPRSRSRRTAAARRPRAPRRRARRRRRASSR